MSRQVSLQKCMYLNEETPHRDPSTIFHSPFKQGSKSPQYANPSFMSSEVFYPHQKKNFNQVHYSRTPKSNLVTDDSKADNYSYSKSPMRNGHNKSQSKYSYMNDYQKFLDKQDNQSENKSQASYKSYNSNNVHRNNDFNKTYHFSNNKSVSTNADFGQPPQNSSATPKHAKNLNSLSHIVGQDTTAHTPNKNRSHSYYDIADVKQKIALDNSQVLNRNNISGQLTPNRINQQQTKSSNNLNTQSPQTIIKLEAVKNNQKIIQESVNHNPQNPNINYNPRSQNYNSQNEQNNFQPQTPKSHSRKHSQQYQFKDQQNQVAQYQKEPYQKPYNSVNQEAEYCRQMQNDQISVSSGKSNSFKLIKTPQKYQTASNQNYQDLSKSPKIRNQNDYQREHYETQSVSGFQSNQNPQRNGPTTPQKQLDQAQLLQRKGSVSNQNYKSQNDRQSNFDDDKSVASSSSYISQLVCNNCINKDLINERQVKQQKDREKQKMLERQAIEAEQQNQYNQYMFQLEQNQNQKYRYAREIQEQLEQKTIMQKEQQERERNQGRIQQIQLQEEQDRVYRQKLEDLKNYREAYKKDIQNQILSKQEKQQKDKQLDQHLLDAYAIQKEQDIHNYMNQIANKQYQTQKVREELQNQIMEKKRIKEQLSQEDAKYKIQYDKQLQYDMELRQRQLEDKAQEMKQFKDFWNQQQTIKEKQKIEKQRENELIKEVQDAQLENDRTKYFYNLERNEQMKKATAEELKYQIEMKKEQQQRIQEEKVQYGQQLKEQQEIELALARANYHDCDRCHATYPTNHLTKQRNHKSKSKQRQQV